MIASAETRAGTARGVSAAAPPGVQTTASLRTAPDARSFLYQWLLLLIARSPGLTGALVLTLDSGGALVPAAMWPDAIGDISELAGPTQRCVDEGQDVVHPLPDGPRGSARQVLASPVFSDDKLVAAIVLVVQRASAEAISRILADLQWGAGWIDALQRQRLSQAQISGLARSQQALDMLAVLAAHDKVDDACAAMAAELARISACERVAIGLVTGKRLRLTALSQAAWFERRSAMAVQFETAMSEAVEQRAVLSWPSSTGADPGLIVNAHHALATALASEAAVLTVPIVAGTRAVGAVTWQLPPDRLTADFISQAEALAVVLAPLLARLADQSRWWAGKGPAALQRGWAGLRDPRRPGFAVASVAALLVLAAISLIPTTYRVPARAALEGQVQRVIAAPFEGFIVEAPARAGQTVTRGTLLARLDDRDLKLEQQRLNAELSQAEKKRDDALSRHDRAELAVLSAQVAETDARLGQVEERLLRTRIEAPFDGVLVSGDLSQQIGAPIEQGKTLFELAPLTGFRVALKVDERDVRAVAPGQGGHLVLSGMAGEPLAFTVRHVSVAGVEDGQNMFRVEADIAPAANSTTTKDQRLRPGMEGVGKIDATEQHPLLWIWTHRFVDWLRITTWRYLP
ncbi:HlyD family efflux transporter periplasmic adaptor subunit [Paucibacter sp. TC2R-5]|uniref:efflux RND transporter periplasmic adaptor subunit n=1 Tax=Paucibacter sp. TC2R-5 TaxID=2893555 RepID=UPI0021E4339D|nr:HlyD family efflux transporter periplasmic adaptor subunit [Paucibacter sp. TC2R-5]MCV2361694.1 HlyD family efflux transporter periplasmic adaptor subunit [Paucibacter sp. TC2R-5]